ncbi:hypothetical protein C8Q75DRAFT_804401 [Abortiporus biennis]|nr:hypothetical protein C8Q75DRAFT_804401 [Abortiporus biennis]
MSLHYDSSELITTSFQLSHELLTYTDTTSLYPSTINSLIPLCELGTYVVDVDSFSSAPMNRGEQLSIPSVYHAVVSDGESSTIPPVLSIDDNDNVGMLSNKTFDIFVQMIHSTDPFLIVSNYYQTDNSLLVKPASSVNMIAEVSIEIDSKEYLSPGVYMVTSLADNYDDDNDNDDSDGEVQCDIDEVLDDKNIGS